MAKKRKAGGLKPIWIEATGLWYANLGPPGKDGRAKRVYAPKSVDSETKAWEWLRGKLAEQQARRIVGRPSVRRLRGGHPRLVSLMWPFGLSQSGRPVKLNGVQLVYGLPPKSRPKNPSQKLPRGGRFLGRRDGLITDRLFVQSRLWPLTSYVESPPESRKASRLGD